jgi:hypothetical protein
MVGVTEGCEVQVGAGEEPVEEFAGTAAMPILYRPALPKIPAPSWLPSSSPGKDSATLSAPTTMTVSIKLR